jgi:tRNA-binding protein
MILTGASRMERKPQTDFSSFASLDIRVGRIIKVDDSSTKKPTYRITVDFGPEIGVKISCGAYRNYAKDILLGKQVIAVINFGVKKMGPELSEVLILGVPNAANETIYLTPQEEVALGEQVF